MAKFNSYALGKMKKSFGNITTTYTNKQNIAKAKIFSRKDSKTPEVLTQRAKMKILVATAQRMLPVIRKGFVGIGKGSAFNAFVSANMKNVAVDENYVATLDFEHLLVAQGIIYTPKVTVAYDGENQSYTFTQSAQAERQDGFSLPDDNVYGVLLETALQRAVLVPLKKRGEDGVTSQGIPAEWDTSSIQIYCFATTKKEDIASDSIRLAIG